MADSETIFALSTVPGRSAVAVLRLSGPAAGQALEALTGKGRPAPRRAALARLADPRSETTIDHALVLWFPGPESFTGEDMAELQLHGGPTVVAAAVDALGALDGLRPAEPGDFTRRAFHNGKLDLAEVEGLADLIAAETEAQRRQALRQLQGELGRLYDSWRERLLGALAHVEATIDFSDEDLPPGVDEAARRTVGELESEIAGHLGDDRRGERLRDGVHLVIIGPPNAGKSSLLNLLARRDAAIVAHTAGTTRDVIEVHLDLGGYPAVVADTAGLRDGLDGVELEGVRRARLRARDADLRLAVFDGEAWPRVDPLTAALVDADTIVLINKVDLGAPAPPLEVNGRPAMGISVLTGAGIEAMLAALQAEVARRCLVSASPALTRARHREALEECRQALGRSLAAQAPELAAEDLRLAARALGRITGRLGVEDMLDVIFRDFCIGK
ncbi:MAG: tRNA uridine-5-carboxymethylaminomethyl(34) synthesis GTPase MnmE [Alphaproteobacteria bacterium]|nr:tRNA uridine-5-carboxymethylaminomethyl(34) synthesis GTPase MnmE [Alphaproteobacteria bacterium]